MCWISHRQLRKHVRFYVNRIISVLQIRQHMNALKVFKENISSVEDRCASQSADNTQPTTQAP